MRFLRLLLTLTGFPLAFWLAVLPAAAEPIVIGIENKDWPPYYLWENGQPRGVCVSIAVGALKHMGLEYALVARPWNRLLLEVRVGSIDGVLCGTRNADREVYAHFHNEPLLSYDASLFVLKSHPVNDTRELSRSGLTVGHIRGYSYGGEEKKLWNAGASPIFFSGHKGLVHNLAKGSIDAVIDSVLPFFFYAQKEGINHLFKNLTPPLAETPAYILFSRKTMTNDQVQRFSDGLASFKRTDAYQGIIEEYGL